MMCDLVNAVKHGRVRVNGMMHDSFMLERFMQNAILYCKKNTSKVQNQKRMIVLKFLQQYLDSFVMCCLTWMRVHLRIDPGCSHTHNRTAFVHLDCYTWESTSMES